VNIIKLMTKNSSHSTLCIGFKEKYIEETVYKSFIVWQVDNHIRNYIITYIINKLNE
jgi:hypothetical protein